MSGLDLLLAYIAAQMDIFDWPPSPVEKKQYMQLMRLWSRLARSPEFELRVFPQGRFDWLHWWQLVHTDMRFAPPYAAAIVHMFHYFGMLGISEAYAESIGSVLTMLGVDKRKNRLLTSTIHDKVMLKLAGLRGDGTDDVLITRCWAEFLGGAGPERFTFVYKQAHRRAKRFAAGGGSKPIHTYLKQAQQRSCWDQIRIRQLRRIGKVKSSDGKIHYIQKTNEWTAFATRSTGIDGRRLGPKACQVVTMEACPRHPPGSKDGGTAPA